MALGERHDESDHPALLPPLRVLGDLLCRQGQYACAWEGLASRALARQERHLELTHLQMGETLTPLALLAGK